MILLLLVYKVGNLSVEEIIRAVSPEKVVTKMLISETELIYGKLKT